MKKNTNKQLLLLIFFLCFIFIGANSVLALEVQLPGLGDKPDLPAYIAYIFKFGISIAGLIALVSFTIGAVGLIASADNAEAASNAKDRMKGSVLGLILTFLRTLLQAIANT